MEITKGIHAIDLALYLPKHSTVIFSDFHIGFEEEVHKQGILLPRFQLKDTLKRLLSIFSRTGKVKRIVVTGDLKHEFGEINSQEWRDIFRLVDFLRNWCGELVLIQGNHDPLLTVLAGKKGIGLANHCIVGSTMMLHGDVIPKIPSGVKTIIIGHEHPAVVLVDKAKKEKFKCFLVGKYRKKTLIVLPSFNLLTVGTDVVRSELLSPFLQQDIDDFGVFIVNEESGDVLGFGTVGRQFRSRTPTRITRIR